MTSVSVLPRLAFLQTILCPSIQLCTNACFHNVPAYNDFGVRVEDEESKFEDPNRINYTARAAKRLAGHIAHAFPGPLQIFFPQRYFAISTTHGQDIASK